MTLKDIYGSVNAMPNTYKLSKEYILSKTLYDVYASNPETWISARDICKRIHSKSLSFTPQAVAQLINWNRIDRYIEVESKRYNGREMYYRFTKGIHPDFISEGGL